MKDKNLRDFIAQSRELLDGLEALLSSSNEELEKLPYPKMVSIPNRSYSMGKYPVTNEEYLYYLTETGGSHPSWEKEPFPRSDCPVTDISFHEAEDYCAWLSERTGDHYRLPTEDEWEYCCADHKEGTLEVSVFNKKQVAPAGTKSPNSFGLYDMLGNVWEWTQSLYAENTEGRVLRGGSFVDPPFFLRSAFRDSYGPDDRVDNLGLRCVRSRVR